MISWSIFQVLLASAALLSGNFIAVQSPGHGQSSLSAFREDVEVEYLYRQDLEGVYWTTWLGREEKRRGNWREVYFETSEKWTMHGIMRFECFAVDSIGDTTVTVLGYRFDDEFSPQAKPQYTQEITQLDRTNWQSGELARELGYFPPYELFVVAHYRYCGAAYEMAE